MAKPPTPLQQAQAIARAQYAPSDYALGRANAQSKAEQAALAATGAALLKQLQAGVAPAGRTYDAAIGQQQALAQGGANLLASLSPNQQVQSELAAVNAPNAQRAQLAAALQAQYPGQGAVLNIEQGTIPGASLAAERASTQRYLAGLPALAALAEQQSARSLLARAADTRDKLLEQRLGITGQIPGLAQQIQQHLDSLRESAATRAYNAQQAALGREFTANQNLLGREFTAGENAKSRAASKRAAVRAAQAKGYQVVNTSNGVYAFDPATGKLQKLAGAGSGAGGSSTAGLTGNARQKTIASANTGARQAYQGFTNQSKLPTYTSTAPNDPKGWSEPIKDGDGNVVGYTNHHPPIGYQEAIRHAREAGIPLPIILPALNVYYKRGERGRPQVGYYEATKATRTGPPNKRKRK